MLPHGQQLLHMMLCRHLHLQVKLHRHPQSRLALALAGRVHCTRRATAVQVSIVALEALECLGQRLWQSPPLLHHMGQVEMVLQSPALSRKHSGAFLETWATWLEIAVA